MVKFSSVVNLGNAVSSHYLPTQIHFDTLINFLSIPTPIPYPHQTTRNRTGIYYSVYRH